MTNNQTMKVQGYDSKGTLCELSNEQPYSDTTGKHYGMPITTTAFLMMLYRFWLEARKAGTDNPLGDVYWVEFSKASLFRILSQENCEFIRFYFALPTEGLPDASLALEGIGADKKTIKLEQVMKIGREISASKDEYDDPESTANGVAKIGGDELPPHEEKGNGGPSMFPIGAVDSFKNFIHKKAVNLDSSFEDFLNEYYEYAQKTF